jgi:hypothetical protein
MPSAATDISDGGSRQGRQDGNAGKEIRAQDSMVWTHIAATARILKHRAILGVLCAVCAGTSGCGYSLAGRGNFLPDYIQTIGVPTFANRTPVFNLETQLTQKVRSEFIGRGKYKIVPESENVDALLIGAVVSVVPAPANFDPVSQLATRFVLTMNASVELRDVRENKVLWQNPALFFRQEYDVESGPNSLDPATFFAQDINAFERMTTDFARTIVAAILEAF